MSDEANLAVVDEQLFIQCPRCGQRKQADTRDKHICVDCAKAENSRLSYYRQHQEDWVEGAKVAGIDLWNQQPGETQWEFTIWTAYRDSYPGKKPSYGSVAEQLSTTTNVVHKVAQRWSFAVRMQAWMAYANQLTLSQRRQEILDMNQKHISMATSLNTKLATAIDKINPDLLKPGDIASLARLATDLERKARVDTLAQEQIQRDTAYDVENPELKKAPTNKQDLGEVISILLKAGALEGITQIGVKQTTTTEVVAKDAAGASASITNEGR